MYIYMSGGGPNLMYIMSTMVGLLGLEVTHKP